MGQVILSRAHTTEPVRCSIQHSQQSLRTLARRRGVNSKAGCLIVVDPLRCDSRLTFNEAQPQLREACRA